MPRYQDSDASTVTTDVNDFLIVPGQPDRKILREDLGGGVIRFSIIVKEAGEDVVIYSADVPTA